MANRLIRLTAFQNPEFYRAQAMRLPVWNKPRIIGCAENYPLHIGLPRGCLNAVNTETKIRRDIPLGDLSNFCSGVAEVADDIIGESGEILLPRRTPLSSLAASIDKIEAKLRRSNIHVLPVVLIGWVFLAGAVGFTKEPILFF